MKKFTCNYKGSPMRLYLKGKNGKEINDFTFGKVLSENDILNKDVFKESYEKGLIRAFINKGWIIEGEVNVKNKITGTPQPMKKIEKPQGATSEEADAYAEQQENDKTAEEKIAEAAAEFGAKVEDKPADKKVETKTEAKPKAKTTTAKKTKAKKEIKKIDAEESKPEAPKPETKEAEAKEEDDFL